MRIKKGWGLGALVFLFVLTGGVLHAESGPASAGQEPAQELSTLSIGYSKNVFFDVDLNDALVATKLWAEHIVRRTHPGAQVIAAIYPDHAALQRALEQQAVDIVALLTMEYLELKDLVPLEPVMVTEVREGVYERFLLLVRADRKEQNIPSLQKGKIIIEGVRGELPLLWLDTVLLAQGSPGARRFFSTLTVSNKAADTVLPVFFNQADCCVVSCSAFETVTELNPQIGRELNAVVTSPGLVVGIICYRKDFPEQHKAELKKTMAEMHIDPRGSQLVTLFRVKRLTPFSPGFLNSVEALQSEHDALRSGERVRQSPLK
jgi:ABC-type phosphate/phosphonate transport system substrate-binding protein